MCMHACRCVQCVRAGVNRRLPVRESITHPLTRMSHHHIICAMVIVSAIISAITQMSHHHIICAAAPHLLPPLQRKGAAPHPLFAAVLGGV